MKTGCSFIWKPVAVVSLWYLVTAAGCVGTAGSGPEKSGDGTARSLNREPSSISGSTTVTTGTATPHPQKDSPVKTERITGEMLEQAGATHVGQSIQDVSGIQPRR